MTKAIGRVYTFLIFLFLNFYTHIITLGYLFVCGGSDGKSIAGMYDLYRISSYALIPYMIEISFFILSYR